MTALQPNHDLSALIAITCDRLNSAASRRVYASHLRNLIDYVTYKNPGIGFNRPAVQSWKQDMLSRGLAPSSVCQAISAAKALASEAEANGWLDAMTAAAIRDIDGPPVRGQRMGQWLSQEQAVDLLCQPDQGQAKGQRDWIALALMLGCGMRREEVVQAGADRVQRREGRVVLVDVMGKGMRVRTVPVPSWASTAIEMWAHRLYATYKNADTPIKLVPRLIGDRPWESLTSAALWYQVRKYAERIGLKVAPHDLRRTFAQLSYKGGAPLAQIQMTLGHSSVAVTDRYLGTQLDLIKPACDFLGV